MNEKIKLLKEEISKGVIGQEKMIESLIIGLLCDGHILLESVPGLAKTTAVNTLAKSVGLNFKRIQFTPDLLPSDILGAEIFNPKTNEFSIKKGPIFTNLLLADEINRAPSKVQSALLEVMQEKQITIGDCTHHLDLPFLVLATQNPLEQEGAYSLPEAQLDRFMLKVIIKYNNKEDELKIIRLRANEPEKINSVINKEDISLMKKEIHNIHIDEELEKYIVDIIDASRHPSNYNLSKLENLIEFGASPRATIDLHKTSKAYAYLRGNEFVTPVDIATMAYDILRHRIILSYEAEANNISVDDIIGDIFKNVKIP
jgi:MoxR-like ATPase